MHLLLLLLLPACERAPLEGEEPPAWGPEARATLEVHLEAEPGGALEEGWVVLSPGGRDAAADAGGTALFERLEPGPYTLLATAPGYHPAEEEVEVEGGAVSTSLALAPRLEGADLVGQVLDPHGAPVAGVSVTVGDLAVATTAADGTYEALDLAPGHHPVAFLPPDGSPLRPWSSRGLDLEGGAVEVSVTLPGHPPDDATFIGSAACGVCHVPHHEEWATSAHARVAQDPAELAGHPLEGAFLAGDTIALGGGATVTLGAEAEGWTATVADAEGATTGVLPVVEVYGGHRFGAAFAVDVGAEVAVLPAAWAAPGQGLSSQQAPAAFVPAWVDGWLDAGGDLRDPPGPEASWDLQCAGCHATGHALVEDDGFHLDPVVERTVGCESCHGPGSTHREVGSARRNVILNPPRLPAWQQNDGCARCHEGLETADHPFSATPGWPVTAEGEALPPGDPVEDHAVPATETFVSVEAARGFAGHGGALRVSPHHRGPLGYDGACTDCHAPHASPHPAQLHRDPWENRLCTDCHASDFPDLEDEVAHSRHKVVEEIPWGQGTCVGCHLGRAGVLLRPDAVSSVGELRSHALVAWRPEDVLAEFDAAGTDTLPPGQVPVLGCLDCHLQVDAERAEVGDRCACPLGDPLSRSTYEGLINLFNFYWGAP